MEDLQQTPATARTPLRLRVLDSYEEAAPFWRELGGTVRSNELAFDLEAHRIVWEGFYRQRQARLRIFVALEESSCVAIVPLILEKDGGWTFTDDFIIAREYFCLHSRVSDLLSLLPPHLADDLSSFWVPDDPLLYETLPAGAFELKPSREEYLASLETSHRKELLWNWKRNEDLSVEVVRSLETGLLESLREKYLSYWRRKAGGDAERRAYSVDKVATDLALMRRAGEMGKLVALHLRLEGRLVAANFSVLRSQDRVDDYLCLRDPDPELSSRGLGIYAIQQNIETCRRMGVRYYDLSASMSDYKRKFLNAPRLFHAWRRQKGGQGWDVW